MVQKKLLIGAGILTLAGLIGGTSIVSAHGMGKPPIDQETRDAIHNALETGDFQTWKELHGEDHPRSDELTQEHFEQLQALHEAREAGDKDAMQEIAKELGIKRGHRMHKPMMDKEQMEALKNAVENGDYDEWRELMGEKFNEHVSDEQAKTMFQMHQLHLEGDEEGAKALAQELGLKQGKRGGGFFIKNNKPQS